MEIVVKVLIVVCVILLFFLLQEISCRRLMEKLLSEAQIECAKKDARYYGLLQEMLEKNIGVDLVEKILKENANE